MQNLQCAKINVFNTEFKGFVGGKSIQTNYCENGIKSEQNSLGKINTTVNNNSFGKSKGEKQEL